MYGQPSISIPLAKLMLSELWERCFLHGHLIPFFFICVTTNASLASIRAWMSVMDLEIWYKTTHAGCEFLSSLTGFGE
uniref:Similarity n=1 Tax=Microcystis aeruginosa (strain PCC 7806) TaxID=267872 RepID=A8YD96_MICA7|nr:unnamed protein product [Microcystis aeruginosa PCC 7806]